MHGLKLAGLAGVVAVALVVAAPGQARPEAAEGWSATFSDHTGDFGTAPDIGSVVIGSDDSGKATFSVNAPILPTDTTSVVSVVIDSDNNSATGDPSTAAASTTGHRTRRCTRTTSRRSR